MLICHDFCAIKFLERMVTCVRMCNFFGNQRLIFHFGINFHLIFGNSHLTWIEAKSCVVTNASEFLRRNIIRVKIFKMLWQKKLKTFSRHGVVCGHRSCAKFGKLTLCYNLHYYTSWVEKCFAINKHTNFEFLLWFLCKNHKSENLCYMICPFPLVFVGLHLLFTNMLVKLLYDFNR
jgi:hypothetical protein